MHRSLGLGLLGITFIIGGLVSVDAAGPGDKIGFVDLQRTLNETKAGKKAKKKLERDKTKKQKSLDKRQKDLQKAAADLEKQRGVLKPAALQKKEQELQKQYISLQETYMKLQQDLAKQEALLVQEIFGKASPAIQAIAKERGYTMILEKNEGAVLFGNDSLDITSEVNKRVK